MWSTFPDSVLTILRPVVGLLAVVVSVSTGWGQAPSPAERQSLEDLYNSTNGPNWTYKTNWLTDSNLCDWYGIECTNGQITGLKLNQNNLSGEIPSSLSALTSLQVLALDRNQLSGGIPSSLSALTQLQDLYLYRNQLSGGIPSILGTLTNLQRLYLYDNQLSGEIPASLSTLTNLQWLYLHDNQLSGCLPASLSVFCGQNVDLSNNPGLPGGGDFTAFCASGLGSDGFQPIARAQPNPASLGQLVSLSVTTGTGYRWSGPEGFTASVQSPSLNLSNLDQIGLYSVSVANGSASCEATASVSLTVNSADYQALMDLYNSTDGPNWTNNTNWLTDSSPCSWYGVTCVNDQITRLDLNQNNLSGSIPASLSALTNLQVLALYNNQLSGPIPASLSALANLKSLYLNDNNLSGELPSSLSALTNLQFLILNNNQLSGEIPSSLSALTQLLWLYLHNNQLSGSIPSSLSALANLQILFMNNNQLSGSIPASLSALTHLQSLYLNDNNLSGCLPASLSVFCGLYFVNLSGNPGLPGGGDFAAFCSSGLGSDGFQPIARAQPNPASLGQSVSLSVTTGTAYRWSGPEGFVASEQLPTLNMSNVNQGGIYSVSVANGSASCEATASVSLTVNTRADVQALIDLYNSTDGPNWANNTNWLKDGNTCGWYGVTCVNDQITRLDLDNNQLKGSLPTSLSALTQLQRLALYNNQLSGEIPASLSTLTQLQWLDLGKNQVSGSIPMSLSALTNLQVFSLHDNQLSGEIPAGLSALTQLQVLYMNDNNLSGSIPASLSALTQLQLLHLNNNQLSDCLPASLSALCGKDVNLTGNPDLPGGGDFGAFCQNGSGSGMPPQLTASDTTTTNQPISVTASGCLGTLTWNLVGGSGTANGSAYTLTQPGAYTLSASCSLNTCTSSPSAPLSLLINSPTPDLTPTLYLRPTVTYGITDMTLVVDVVEINGVASSGPITVYVPRNSQLAFSFDANQGRVGGRSVQNGSWQFSSTDSYYILTSNSSISAGDELSFGLSGQLNPGSTTGVLSCSAVIVAGSGGEKNPRNNVDANKMDYFQQ